VAKVVESKSKKDVRDVRAFEEKRVLAIPQALLLEQTLARQITSGDWSSQQDAFAFRTLLRTGLRRFEFCKLRVGDFVGDRLHVIGKGNLRDFVPLPEPAVTTLSQWLVVKQEKGESVESKAFLFLGRGDGPMSFSLLRLRWKKMLALAGLKDHYGLHTLRHTAGLLVYAATGDLAKTARFLRHTDTKTTADFYLHVDADQLRADLSKIDVWKL